MRIALILFACCSALAAAPPSALQIAPVANPSVNGVLPLPAGHIAVFGSVANACALGFGPCSQNESPLLLILDASGNQSAGLMPSAFGRGNSVIAAAAMDSSGNIWVTGETDSDDFPLVKPLYPTKSAYAQTGFVAKLDPALNILFSSFLAGTSGSGTPTNLTIDSAGNAIIAGYTTDPNYPVTGPTFGEGSPSGGLAVMTYAFVSKISADGSKLIFSRFLGGNKGVICLVPEIANGCQIYNIATRAAAVAVDAGGNLTVAGATNVSDFPTTTDVGQSGGGAFVTRISGDGSQLLWSTELGVPRGGTFSSVQSLALDSAGNVYVVGSTPLPLPAITGALQPMDSPQGAYGGFAVKLSSNGASLLFATNLSGMAGSSLTGLALDANGNIWITGNTSSPDFPGLNNATSRNLDFVLELNPNASALDSILALIPGTVTAAPVFDSNGNLALAASAGNVLRLNTSTALTAPAVFALTNSAVPHLTTGLSPGELATIYGVGLGPASGLSAIPDQNGSYPTQLGGVTVQFGSGPAPLLYVSNDQINFQAPFDGPSGNITVITPAGTLTLMQIQPVPSIGIFGVVNQDGTVNSPSNPASTGSIVSLYATGLGAPFAGAPNGTISTSANPAFLGSIEVPQQSVRSGLLPVLYAGTAPGLINGMDQLNVELPAGILNPQLSITTPANTLFTPAAASNTVVVYTK